MTLDLPTTERVCIKPAADNDARFQDGAAILTAATAAIDPVELGISLKGSKVSNRKVLLTVAKTDVNKLKECQGLLESGLQISRSVMRRPLILINSVPNELAEDYIWSKGCSAKLPTEIKEEYKIIGDRNRRRDKRAILIEVSNKVRRELMTEAKILVDLRPFFLDD